jgi:hypothetical protein
MEREKCMDKDRIEQEQEAISEQYNFKSCHKTCGECDRCMVTGDGFYCEPSDQIVYEDQEACMTFVEYMKDFI